MRAMSPSYSFPLLPAGEMVSSLSQLHILTFKSEDLSNPTFDIVSSIYTAILSHLDPLGEDLSNADFGALELLENPDGHFTSVRVLNLYHKMTDLIASSCSMDFTLKDLLFLKRDRTALNKEILNHEEMSKMEQPIIQEVEAEVKELQQTIQSLNKQQMSLKASFRTVNDKTKEIDDKISSAEFELGKHAQEFSKLQSKIVQSPDKLQRALEEKKSIRAEAKNAERAAMQCFQERSSTVEVYLKACKKLSKHLVEMQALQEQVNYAKAVDKDVKVLKAKLSDEGVLDMSVIIRTPLVHFFRTFEAELERAEPIDISHGLAKIIPRFDTTSSG
ncbi:Kinetochore protein Nuf2 [Cinnamomum micranthum f. kanehirae]|uniref:Kinetochore protein Nuf2 n=1 Tax=Cinnamomum micranthum f. kanehirae TaxID=337451 RepID=A0A443NBR7_9MAGN|nr:Kinetochore protein Nuf2 [Cinnamomum micranthum f. kanehirae]